MKKQLLLAFAAVTIGTMPTVRGQLVWQRVESAPGLVAGTTTDKMPFNNTNTYSYTQSIYNKDTFQFTAGAEIDTVWFYCVTPATTAAVDESVTLMLGETDQTVGTGAKNWLSVTSAATYTATVQPTQAGWFPIALTSAYSYSGLHNLVVVVYRMGSGGSGQTYSAATGVTARTSMGYVNAAEWTSSKTGVQGITVQADIRLSVRAPRVNQAVDNLASAGSTTTTATVAWNINERSKEPLQYKIEYGLRGFTEGTGTVVVTDNAAATNYTIEGLTASMWYDVYVSSVCGENDTSASRKVSVATACTAKSLPWTWTYTEGQLTEVYPWENENELPICWEFPIQGANKNSYPQYWIRVETTTNRPYLTLITDTIDTAMAVLPEFEVSINHLLISFTATVKGIEYGYVTDATDASTFRLLGAASIGANKLDYEELGMEVPGGARIAFRLINNQDYNIEHIGIKDLTVSVAPSCKRPGHIVEDEAAATTSSVSFSWSGVMGAGNSYRLKVVKLGETDTAVYTGLTTQSFTLTTYNDAPLTAGTMYYLYVDKLCGGQYTERVQGMATTLGVVYVSVESACTGMGTVHGVTTGLLNTTSSFRAVPNNHYHFVEWSDGSTTNPRNIIYLSATQATPYTATFAINTHTINFVSNNDSYGTVTNTTGSYAYGSIASSTATPAAGYQFVGWSDGTTSNTITHTVRADNTLTAYFVPEGQILYMGALRNSVAGYSITQTPADGIVSEGETVSITVTAADEIGYYNTWITEPVSKSHTTGTTTYTATYTAGSTSKVLVFNNNLKPFVLMVTMNNSNFGEVAGAVSGSTMYLGESVFAMAAPAAHCKFARWTGYMPGTTNPLEFTMPASNTAINAVFRRDSITVRLIGEEGGTATLTYKGTSTVGTDIRVRVAVGDVYTISAAPTNSHYTFFQWSDAVGTAERSFTASGKDGVTQILTAMFSPEILDITASSNMGVCTVSGSNSYAYNTKAKLIATPESHYDFVRWSQSGSEVSTDATYVFKVLASGNYLAEFTPKTYTITATSEDALRGSVSGSGYYIYGNTVTLSATPEPGWAFTQWSDGNTSNPRIFVAEEDVTVTALFEQEVYHLTLTAINGTITDEATIEATAYHYGDVVTLEAINADPLTYRWAGWTDGGAPTHTYTVTASASLTATFAAMDRYIVNISTNNDLYGFGSTDAADYTSAQTAEVRATAYTGYRFDHWNNIPTAHMYDNPLRIDMDEHDTVIQAIFEAIPYTVSTSVNNASWGTLTGGGAYTYQSTAILTAIPMPGYRVDSWSTGTSRNLTQSSVTVMGDTAISVVFCPDTFTVSATAAHATITMTHGSLEVAGASGKFAYGSQITLSAMADAYYTGDRWDDGNTNATRTITVGNEDKTYVYYTTIDTYTITGVSDNPAMGYVTGSDTRAVGQQTTLVAHANPHYAFLQWSDGLTDANRVETFTSNRNYTAYFTIGKHTITLAGGNASLGTVSINGGAATGAFDYGSTLMLRACPNAGVRFVGWAEDGITDTLRTYTVADDATLTATWDSIAYTLDTMSNNLAMGHISAYPTKAYYRYGDTVVLTAELTNSSLYRFVGWSDGETSSTHSTITFSDNETVRISAIFEEKSRHIISVMPNNNSWGSTTGSATGLTNGIYSVSATPLYNYVEFLGWSDNSSTESPRAIVINDNDFIATANFGLKSYTVVSADAAANGTVSGIGAYPYGSSVTLYANANADYIFRGWSNGVTQNPYTFTLVQDTTINPIFTLDSVDIAIMASHVDAISGTGRYAVGAPIHLGITPTAHYHVERWMLDGNTVGTFSDTLPTFYASTNATYVVEVGSDQTTLWVGNAQPAMGYVEGAQLNTLISLDYGTVLTLTATPNTHHEFAGWITPNGDTVSHTATLAFAITTDTHLTACFCPIAIAVSTTTANATMGNTTASNADGYYIYGDLFTAVATPATGFHFKQWLPGNITTNPYTFQVQTNTALTAEFEASTYTLTALPNDPTMGSIILAPSQAYYNYGDTISVSVNYDATRYRFICWSNGDTRTSFDTVITSDIHLIAIFNDALQKNISVFATGNGTAVASATSVYEGTTVTITATPNDTNTYFDGWSNGLTAAVANITVTTDTMLTATFLPKQRTLDILTTGRGTVAHNATYPHGTTLTLVAEPAPHAHFLRWENGSTILHRTIILDSSLTLTALFANDSVSIQASAINGQVSVSDTLVSYDSTFYLTATAADHYSHFIGWTRNGVAITGGQTLLIDAQSDGIYQATFAIDTVSLVLGVNDPAKGAIVGATTGVYPYGTRIQLAASAARNHHFVGWDNNPQLTTSNLDTTLTTNTTLTALFCLDSFDVAVSTDATLHFGTAFIDGNRTRFGYGELATLRARPLSEMYRFVGWSDGNTDSVRILNITSNITLTARFDTIWYTATATSNNISMGRVVTRNGYYYHGETLHASAITNDSTLYRFIGWSHGYSLPSIDTVITSNVSLLALFDLNGYSLTVISSDSTMGTVTGSGIYQPHQLATISATPTQGYSFLMWSDGVTTATRQIYITSDTTLTAYFSINRYTVSLNINDPSMGTVSGVGSYLYGDTATLIALPNPHHRFAGFNGGSASIDSISFVVTADTVINADFVRDMVRLYTHATHGTLNITSGGILINQPYQPFLVYYGDSVALHAIPDSGYHFTHYIEYSIVYDTVIDSVRVIDSIIVNGTHNDTIAHYEPRITLNLIYTPIDTLTCNSIAYLATADRYIEVLFARNLYTLTLSGRHATLTGDSTYHHGANATIAALCDSHYHFVAWLNTMGDTISRLNPYTFPISSDIHLIAAVAIDRHRLTLNATTGGSTTGDGYYDYGTIATITAVANDGYYFIAWSDGDTNATRQLLLTSDTTLTATFYLLDLHQADLNNINIYATGQAIHVQGATGQAVHIYDAVGRRVATVGEATSDLVLPVETTGIYMVQVGNHRVRRVMVVR